MDKLIKQTETLTVKELKAELKARGITLNANKAVLVERIIKEFKRDELERLHGDNVADENNPGEYDGQRNEEQNDDTHDGADAHN